MLCKLLVHIPSVDTIGKKSRIPAVTITQITNQYTLVILLPHQTRISGTLASNAHCSPCQIKHRSTACQHGFPWNQATDFCWLALGHNREFFVVRAASKMPLWAICANGDRLASAVTVLSYIHTHYVLAPGVIPGCVWSLRVILSDTYYSL
jgi:hypothetical protein